MFFLPFFSLTLLLLPLLKELELYREELVSKPALLVVNKMDLPEAEDKLAKLREQLQNPDGRFDGFFYYFILLVHHTLSIQGPCARNAPQKILE